MEGGPPRFRRGFSCPALLRYPCHACQPCFAYGTLTRSGGAFQLASTTRPTARGTKPRRGPTTPRGTAARFGLLPFRSPLLRESHVDFSSWRYLDVSVLSVGLLLLSIQNRMTGHHPRRVPPFGHRRIQGCVLLPDAFRSLPRPSSPIRAQASTVRPSSLDRISRSISGPPILSATPATLHARATTPPLPDEHAIDAPHPQEKTRHSRTRRPPAQPSHTHTRTCSMLSTSHVPLDPSCQFHACASAASSFYRLQSAAPTSWHDRPDPGG